MQHFTFTMVAKLIANLSGIYMSCKRVSKCNAPYLTHYLHHIYTHVNPKFRLVMRTPTALLDYIRVECRYMHVCVSVSLLWGRRKSIN